MGNNAKELREVCQQILDLLMLRGDGKAYCILTWDEFNESQKMLRRVLSDPPRNCDVGTVEEQTERYHATGEVYHTLTLTNALEWAQMPYESEAVV